MFLSSGSSSATRILYFVIHLPLVANGEEKVSSYVSFGSELIDEKFGGH
jgi:hypothetical protein